MDVRVTVSVDTNPAAGGLLLAPLGLPTPYQCPVRFTVDGGEISLIGETTTGQQAALIVPRGSGPVILTHDYADGGPGYPDAIFRPHASRYTRPADALVRDALRVAASARDGHAGIEAIVADTASKFDYGHPEVRFHEGRDEVPHLSCGLTEGSCVDINTYLVAALRAAGFEAGYVTGYFFPEEKNGCCLDMHCWVVTRHDGVVQEWDIAHHLKMGTRTICCGLNPKPGARVAMAHSMGLDFPSIGVREAKLIGEPMWVTDAGQLEYTELQILMEPVSRARRTDVA
jgi:hypothetical protein